MIPRRTTVPGRAPRAPSSLAVLAWLGALLGVAGCAATDEEKHAAPLFTQISTAGGGTSIEALGGAIQLLRPRPDAEPSRRALRPLWIRDRVSDELTLTRFLVPLGRAERTPHLSTQRLLPIYSYASRLEPTGHEWTFFCLPGIYWSQRDDRVLRAWFPFGGVFENFLSFDRVEFFLWPIWMRTERHGRKTQHLLWPVFGVTVGRGEPSWHVWPFYGFTRIEGSWDRRYALWPIFHWHENGLSRPEDLRETKWMVWPLFGRSRRGTYRSTTVLWPFFGYARDPETGFWAWDGPWPLVRLRRGGKDDYRRTRFWPFYSYYKGDQLESEYFLWPLLGRRHEEYPSFEKDREFAFPLWQFERTRRFEDGAETTWRKLWPFFQVDRGEAGDTRRIAVPALNPLWRTREMEDAYAWIWELWVEERGADVRRQRSWLGLWRREVDACEDRRSIVGLWARRDYAENGERVTERSFVFGLLRFRAREGHGLQWLPPAMPGPGWPLERSSEPMGSTSPPVQDR